MIGKLSGILDSVTPTEILLDVNGVGYEVSIPLSTYDNLPREGEKFTIYTYLYVREDAMVLYGFSSMSEKGLFKILITASGVGPKLGLKILSSVSAQSFCSLITNADIKGLSKINGLGKKTAEKLVIELREKVIDFAPESLYGGDKEETALSRQAEEAVLALIQLGFKYDTAKKAVKKAASTLNPDESNSENLVRFALQGLNS